MSRDGRDDEEPGAGAPPLPARPAAAEGAAFESFVDRLIREAREQGEFDGLGAAGRPLAGLDAPYDELWWVKKKLREERASLLPPALGLRAEVERGLEEALAAPSEAEARRRIEELDRRIRAANRSAAEGPASTLAPLDVEALVARWRARRR